MKNKVGKPQKDFLRALANYTALSGALVGSMSQAQATIQYATLSGTPVSDGSVLLPLPAGTANFVEAAGRSSAVVYIGGNVSVSGGTWYPFPLNANVPVNSGGAWQNAATQFLAWGPFSSGYFSGTTGKFIAFRFNSGGIKYGWIRLDVANAGTSFTLIDWAYQDDGSPILTGDTGTPFPIELLSLTLKRMREEVALEWATAQEDNFSGFSVERAEEGGKFDQISWVAGQGNSSGQQNYTFRDQTAIDNKRYYYRLKMVDLDGSYQYSRLIEASVSHPGYAVGEPYPNPVRGQAFQLDIEAMDAETVTLRVFAAMGQIVYEDKVSLSQGRNTLSLEIPALAAGTYFLKVEGRYYHAYKKLIVER